MIRHRAHKESLYIHRRRPHCRHRLAAHRPLPKSLSISGRKQGYSDIGRYLLQALPCTGTYRDELVYTVSSRESWPSAIQGVQGQTCIGTMACPAKSMVASTATCGETLPCAGTYCHEQGDTATARESLPRAGKVCQEQTCIATSSSCAALPQKTQKASFDASWGLL